MKKTLILFLITLLLVSCNKAKPEVKKYSEYSIITLDNHNFIEYKVIGVDGHLNLYAFTHDPDCNQCFDKEFKKIVIDTSEILNTEDLIKFE